MNIAIPNNEKEFVLMMEAIDLDLRKKDVPTHARPIQGWLKISGSLNLSLSMFPRSKTTATPNSYIGDDLTIRIFDWFDERYGEKLKFDFGPGRIVLLIRGDPWEALMPKIFGTVEFFISASEKSSNQEEDLRLGRRPRCNILDSIHGLPLGLIHSLEAHDLNQIWKNFFAAFSSLTLMGNVRNQSMMREAMSDIDAAVGHFVRVPAHYGLSKWSSLQATEKTLKSYLAIRGASIPHSHDLLKLSSLAAQHGAQGLSKNDLDSIQCPAAIRYGEEKVSKSSAYSAHLSSIRVCGVVSKQLGNLTTETSGSM